MPHHSVLIDSLSIVRDLSVIVWHHGHFGYVQQLTRKIDGELFAFSFRPAKALAPANIRVVRVGDAWRELMGRGEAVHTSAASQRADKQFSPSTESVWRLFRPPWWLILLSLRRRAWTNCESSYLHSAVIQPASVLDNSDHALSFTNNPQHVLVLPSGW